MQALTEKEIIYRNNLPLNNVDTAPAPEFQPHTRKLTAQELDDHKKQQLHLLQSAANPWNIEKAEISMVLNPNYIFKGNPKIPQESKRTAKQIEAQVHLKNNTHNNVLSAKARKSISFALNWLYASATPKDVWSAKHRKTFSFKVNFITLTVPSYNGDIVPRNHIEELINNGDGLIKNPQFNMFQEDKRNNVVEEKIFQTCINSFLTYMRLYHKLGNYVWKIEAQQNGQLHIHLSTDQYIKYSDINIVWNRILAKHGLLDKFFSQHGHYNAPSTDVHSTKKMWNAIAYIGGYMAKDPNFCKSYNGRIWGCSRGLSPKNKLKIKVSFPEWREIRKEIISKNFEHKECIVKDKDGNPVASAGWLFMLKKYDAFKIMHPLIREQYHKHREFIQSCTPKQKKEYMVLDLFGEQQFIDDSSDITQEIQAIQEPVIIIPEQLTIFDEQIF